MLLFLLSRCRGGRLKFFDLRVLGWFLVFKAVLGVVHDLFRPDSTRFDSERLCSTRFDWFRLVLTLAHACFEAAVSNVLRLVVSCCLFGEF